MLKGYRILDADCHVLEPDSMWTEGLSPEFKDRGPRYVADTPAETAEELVERFGWRGLEPSLLKFVIDGKDVFHALPPVLRGVASRETDEQVSDAELTPEEMTAALDRMGIDVAFLYPTMGLHLLAIDDLDPALTVQLARSYNDWIGEFCGYAPERLLPVGVVARHDPEAMVEELSRIVERGWRAVHLRPNAVCGRRLSDPAHEGFWDECEKHRIAVGIHEASHARTATAGYHRFSTRFAIHACSHPMEQMMAFLDLLEGGVLERHPTLHFAFLEAGGTWLPYWLWRLDREFEDLEWEVRKTVAMEPSRYFLRQCFVAIEPDENGLEHLVDTVGNDRILLGSDFPHMDHDKQIISKAVDLESSLGAETVRKLLWDNPCRFYRLPMPETAARGESERNVPHVEPRVSDTRSCDHPPGPARSGGG